MPVAAPAFARKFLRGRLNHFIHWLDSEETKRMQKTAQDPVRSFPVILKFAKKNRLWDLETHSFPL
jgi:hypothetical protein